MMYSVNGIIITTAMKEALDEAVKKYIQEYKHNIIEKGLDKIKHVEMPENAAINANRKIYGH